MIVVIEDDELAGRLLLKMLDEFFKDIVTVWLKSTSEAIDFFKNNTLTKKDLIFLDNYLSDSNAWDLLDALKTKGITPDAKLILIPGISLTPSEIKKSKGYKLYKTIVKPIGLQQLKDVLAD